MILALAIIGLFVLPDPWRVVVLGAALVIEVGEVYLWIRFLRRYRVTTGAEGLIGESVVVIESCRPRGRARVRGEIWNARSAGRLEVGEPARIVSVDGLTLVLEADSQR